MSDETDELPTAAQIIAPLTLDEWLAIRQAAMKWVEQVNGAMPGPEPLLGAVKAVLVARDAALARELSQIEHDLDGVLMGYRGGFVPEAAHQILASIGARLVDLQPDPDPETDS